MSVHFSRRDFGLLLVGLGGAKELGADTVKVPTWANQLVHDLNTMADTLTQQLKPWHGPSRIDTPESHGFSAANGLATPFIQRAIDTLNAKGGGTVRLSKGEYVSGTIDLRSNIRLEISADSRLVASTDLKNWPDRIAKRRTVMDTNMGMNQSLIFAEGCENIAIGGKGVIDGRGAQFKGEETIHGTPGRPFLIRVLDCNRVHISGLTMLDSPCWMQNYLNCENLLLEQLRIENQANFNNDGCDIDGCRNVIVRHCYISSGDDSLCFKGASLKPTENVLIEHCTLLSSCNALKLGTDSQSVFRNVLARNLVVGGVSEEMRRIKHAYSDSGISWEVVDGGIAENIIACNIHIVRALSPLFMRLDDRGRTLPNSPKPAPGRLRRVVFDNITGESNGARGSYFLGMPDRAIEDIVLRKVRLDTAKSLKPVVQSTDIPEMHGEYPDAHMIDSIGDSPAAGLWTRHVKQLVIADCSWKKSVDDIRPPNLIQD